MFCIYSMERLENALFLNLYLKNKMYYLLSISKGRFKLVEINGFQTILLRTGPISRPVCEALQAPLFINKIIKNLLLNCVY